MLTVPVTVVVVVDAVTTFLSQNDLSDGLASSSFSSQTKPKKSSQARCTLLSALSLLPVD